MKYLIFISAICFMGCIDLGLLDEMVEVEGDTGEREGDTDGVDNLSWFGELPGETPLPDPEDLTAPLVISLTCDAGEINSNGACVSGGSGVAAVRVLTDEAATVEPSWGGRLLRLSSDLVTQHGVLLGDVDEQGSSVELRFQDASGNSSVLEVAVEAPFGPTVAITEVLADSHGAEPTQEFVELANFGDNPVDLSGWMVDDNGDLNGDLLPEGTVLAAGAVLLVVGPGFDENDGQDPVPLPGTQLVRLESSIASSGLKNSDPETVELYDEAGALVSQFAPTVTPAEGHSVTRLAAALPDGCASGIVVSNDGPTPGLTRFWD